MHRSLSIVVASLALSMAACRSNETIARESFAREHSCPNERITITQRKDLSAAELAVTKQTPSKEIAADPARLAIWQKEQAQRASNYDGASVIQASGCDHEIFYVCGDLKVSVGATRHICEHTSYSSSTK